jgi:hypothetical protein
VLTALTQYNHVLFSQRLFDARDRVAAALRRYFAERIAPRIGAAFDAYVVDFAICGHLGPSVTALDDDTHLSLDRMRVIELNPWAPTTDAGLFAWTSAADACVLNGERAFEFRVRERAEANMRAALMDSWRTLLEAVVAEVKRREKLSAVQSAYGAEP